MKVLIEKDSPSYKWLRFRWLLYCLIAFLFAWGQYCVLQAKSEHRSTILGSYEEADFISYAPSDPEWLYSLPDWLLNLYFDYGESFYGYEIEWTDDTQVQLEFLREISHFDNVEVLYFSGPARGFLKWQNPLESFRYIGQMQGLENLSFSIDEVTPDLLEAIKNLPLKDCAILCKKFDSACIEVLTQMESLERLTIKVDRGLSFSDVLRLGKLPGLKYLDINCYGYNNLGFPLENLPSFSSLEELSLDWPLQLFLAYTDKFPRLKRLETWGNTVLSDEHIALLGECSFSLYTSSIVSSLKLGVGVSAVGLAQLHKIKELKGLEVLRHYELDAVKWAQMTELERLKLPPYFNIRKFLEKELPPNLQELSLARITIDLELAKSLVVSGFRDIELIDCDISEEVASFLKSKLSISHRSAPKFGSSRWKELPLLEGRKRVQGSWLSAEDIFNIKDKNVQRLSFCCRELTDDYITALDQFPFLKEIEIEVYKGLEKLNQLKRVNEITVLDVRFCQQPLTPLKMPGLQRLWLTPEDSTSLKQVIDLQITSRLYSLIVSDSEGMSDFSLSGLDQFKNLQELTLENNRLYLPEVIALPNLKLMEIRDVQDLNILKSLATVRNVKDCTFYFSGEVGTNVFRELFPIAHQVDELGFYENFDTPSAFDLLLEFKNLQELDLPYDKRTIHFETLKKLLSLPQIKKIDLGSQVLTDEEFRELNARERQILDLEDDVIPSP